MITASIWKQQVSLVSPPAFFWEGEETHCHHFMYESWVAQGRRHPSYALSKHNCSFHSHCPTYLFFNLLENRAVCDSLRATEKDWLYHKVIQAVYIQPCANKYLITEWKKIQKFPIPLKGFCAYDIRRHIQWVFHMTD